MNPFPGPTPPYSNPPINPQYYKPRVFQISNISLGRTTTITTVDDMNYVIGQLVRLVIPMAFGCTQINGHVGYVIDIPADNEVTIGLFSSYSDPFISKPSLSNQPHILAIGDINSGAQNSDVLNQSTSIPGSFINVSPA